MADDLLRLLGGLTDEQFERLYGPLARLSPDDAATLLDGLDAPWWVVGGWAMEAFSGVERPHEDLDLCVLARDVPLVVQHFLGSHHLWATGGGVMCPIVSVDQQLPPWLHQIWIRESAADPWLLDIIITPDRDGRWVFHRDPAVVADLDTVTWTAPDGIVYQRPEVTLAFKAAHARTKDTADLHAALPLLDERARRWLRETVARLHPAHRWLDLL